MKQMLHIQELWWAAVAWLVPLALLALGGQHCLPLPVLLQGAAPFQCASPESTAKSGGWGEGAAQPALSLQDPKRGSVLGHGNGNRWSMYLHVFTCVQRKIRTAWETHSQSDVRIIQRKLQQKDSWQLEFRHRKSLAREAGKGGTRLSDVCVTASLGDKGALTCTSAWFTEDGMKSALTFYTCYCVTSVIR